MQYAKGKELSLILWRNMKNWYLIKYKGIINARNSRSNKIQKMGFWIKIIECNKRTQKHRITKSVKQTFNRSTQS